MRRQFIPSIISMVIFTVALGIVFPLVVLGIGQLAFHDKANGSIIECNGKAVGSSLIGQSFTDKKGNALPEYFQSRPSAAAGVDGSTVGGYDPTLSSGSNLGPTNPDFLKTVKQRVKDYRELNGLSDSIEVPVDAVTASGSGLDPHISIANARLQAKRVADERGISVSKVNQLIDDNTSGRALGILGEKAVNVVDLNLALDHEHCTSASRMARGSLRIYLGAAPGVGKTYAMLNEGNRARERGSDIVVGYLETHGRPNTEAQLRTLEVVPRQQIHYRGVTFEEMDVDAILKRKPERVLVDELAHTNVPGSRNPKRWQDVNELLDSGIDVISTVNVQHLESMNDVVEQITGIKQNETIPDAIVREADQIELVDMSPEALRRRMAHGNIYPAEKVDASLANFFRQGNLGALRELALMWVADRVDEALEEYREAHGIARPWETRERVVVAITGAPGGDDVIRRAARMAARAHGELIGVYVRSADGLRAPPSDALEEQRRLLDELGGEYRVLASADVAASLVQFAQAENATQIVLGASRQSRWTHLLRGSVINNVIRASGPIDVHVISSTGDDQRPEPSLARGPRHRITVSPRRRALAWSLAIGAPPLLTLILAQLRDGLTLPSDLLMFMLVVVVVAALGGFVPAFVCAISGFLFANWFFTPPFYEFTVEQGENLVALVVFLLVAGVVSMLVSTASRRTAEAAQARAEAETLAALSGTLAAATDPLPQLVAQVQVAFDADAVAVLAQGPGSDWVVVAHAGGAAPESPDAADLSVPLYGDHMLVLQGRDLGLEDLEILQAFASQVGIAVQQRTLRADAARVEGLEEANELRTALLAAVSHDLRTPLSSIKASVSSLLQRDVDFTPGATRELLETIDDGADRLNHLIGNLLDMSRLQTGAVQLVMRAVALEEVVPAALAGLSQGARVDADVPETLPRVTADAALLERAVANIVENALAWSPSEHHVRVEACVVDHRVDLRVVDRGPGIPRGMRDQVFQPFQRLGDSPNGSGVGLGLAVARGFVEAMGGEIAVDDTPGGGTTMVISLEVSPT